MSGRSYWAKYGVWHWQNEPLRTACKLEIKDLRDWQAPWLTLDRSWHFQTVRNGEVCQNCVRRYL